jgi:hypothetical protein
MAITVASVSAVATGDTAASLACNAPSGVTSGDLLVLCIGNSTTTRTITTPTGWTQIANVQDGFGSQRGAMYRRIADGSSDDTPTVSFGGTCDSAAFILRITGQHATTYLDTSASASQTSGATAAIPSITTAEADELLIAMVSVDDATISSDPSGWTQVALFNAAGSVAHTLGVWSRAAGAAGSYGTETVNLSFSEQATRIVSAFKAAAGGGGGASPWLYRRSSQLIGMGVIR